MTTSALPNPRSVREARLYASRLEAVFAPLLDFYEPHEVIEWLFAHQPLLNGEQPAKMLLIEGGKERCLTVIAQLQDGAYI